LKVRKTFSTPRDADLSPAPAPAHHVCVGHGGEECVRLQVLGQAGQELGDVNEVHLEQDFLEQSQDTEPRPKQALLPVPTEDVPHPARYVQWEGLTVQSEDPGQTHKGSDFTKSMGSYLSMYCFYTGSCILDKM